MRQPLRKCKSTVFSLEPEKAFRTQTDRGDYRPHLWFSIRVEPHAHFADAYQKVRNLLLSDDAEANSMPGLEILADNVRCTHGATSGQIDEDELFYLRTRGIPVSVAQRLIVTGFLDEVIQRLNHPAIADHLNRLIEEKFAT